jgi:putative Mg2+ transporter-C (MgtC) family protein
MEDIIDADWHQIGSHLAKMILAYLLALPIAWDQEKSARGAGLRTFPLVAVGSCGYVLVGLYVLTGSESHARILYGLMTGIGFIGGGAILKQDRYVTGTATAASIWITGAVGAAVAWNRFEIAVLLSIINFLTLRLGKRLKEHDPDMNGQQ